MLKISAARSLLRKPSPDRVQYRNQLVRLRLAPAGARIFSSVVPTGYIRQSGAITRRDERTKGTARVADPKVRVDDAPNKMRGLRSNVRVSGMGHNHSQELLHFQRGHAETQTKHVLVAAQRVICGQAFDVSRCIQHTGPFDCNVARAV